MGLSGMMCHVCQTYPSVEIPTQRIGENAEECVQLFGYNNITRPLSCFPLQTQNALRKQSICSKNTHFRIQIWRKVTIQMDLWGAKASQP